jgi:hypothetical protein
VPNYKKTILTGWSFSLFVAMAHLLVRWYDGSMKPSKNKTSAYLIIIDLLLTVFVTVSFFAASFIGGALGGDINWVKGALWANSIILLIVGLSLFTRRFSLGVSPFIVPLASTSTIIAIGAAKGTELVPPLLWILHVLAFTVLVIGFKTQFARNRRRNTSKKA